MIVMNKKQTVYLFIYLFVCCLIHLFNYFLLTYLICLFVFVCVYLCLFVCLCLCLFQADIESGFKTKSILCMPIYDRKQKNVGKWLCCANI